MAKLLTITIELEDSKVWDQFGNRKILKEATGSAILERPYALKHTLEKLFRETEANFRAGD